MTMATKPDRRKLTELAGHQCYDCVKKVKLPEDGRYQCGVLTNFYFSILDKTCWAYSNDPYLWLQTMEAIKKYNNINFGSSIKTINQDLELARKAVKKASARDLREVMAEDRKRGGGSGGTDPVGTAAGKCRMKDNRLKMKWGEE